MMIAVKATMEGSSSVLVAKTMLGPSSLGLTTSAEFNDPSIDSTILINKQQQTDLTTKNTKTIPISTDNRELSLSTPEIVLGRKDKVSGYCPNLDFSIPSTLVVEGKDQKLNGCDDDEGSLCLDDLVDEPSIDFAEEEEGYGSDASNSDDGSSSVESPLQKSGSEEGNNKKDDNDDNDDGSSDFNQSRRSTSRNRRRRQRNEKGWENLSSSTVYSALGNSVLDMSSRSLLEDCDFDPDATDNDTDDENTDGIGSIPKTPVRFSAGRAMVNRGTPMSRITEHTRESSAYGSYSDLSGRNSFEDQNLRVENTTTWDVPWTVQLTDDL